MMDRRPPCRYFQLGTCRNGEACSFSHAPEFGGSAAPGARRVCSYYLDGACAFGERCRFEHPTNLPRAPSSNGHASATRALNASAAAWTPGAPVPQYTYQAYADNGGEADEDDYGSDEERFLREMDEQAFLAEQQDFLDQALSDDEIDFSVPSMPETPTEPASGVEEGAFSRSSSEEAGGRGSDAADTPADSAPAGPREPRPDEPLCTNFYATGKCPRDDRCKFAHGLICETCKKHALHPDNEEDREAHTKACSARQNRLATVLATAEVECSICLERVMERETPAERKFGILDCEHAFCLSCIRSWRSQTGTDADLDTAIRACPICRAPSWFVTPSTTWPSSQEEKERIQVAYKEKLASLDCRYFNKGEGQCPFGTSCFYRHVYPDGRPEERKLRKSSNADGELTIIKDVRLSDFLTTPAAQRAFSSRPPRR